jgi:hypothetical protein
MTEGQSLPRFETEELKGGVRQLCILLTEDELAFIAKGKGFDVLNKERLFDDFIDELKDGASGNAVENGWSNLQQLFDDAIDEVYVNGEDVLADPLADKF